MRFIAILILVCLAGCGGHKLAECKGPVFQLNAGQWEPTPEELGK